MRKTTAWTLTRTAVIAGLYCVLTLALAPLSFGGVQVRVAEALTILPAFSPSAIWGLTLGCAISNAAGLAMGANVAGAVDIVVGTLATLLAALCSYGLRHYQIKGVPVLSALPPIVVNSLLVGGELAIVLHLPVWLTMLQVGAGQATVLVLLGLPLSRMINRSSFIKQFF